MLFFSYLLNFIDNYLTNVVNLKLFSITFASEFAIKNSRDNIFERNLKQLLTYKNFMMPSFVDILEFAGTFAFAISGIRLASAKRFDWFGAYVVGVVTAIGGGTIRDVLLDVTPFWMTNPMYLICSAIALFWVIIFGKYLIHLNNTFFIFDTIGLALFVVVGVEKTLALDYPIWVAVIMATLTGSAGGVMRDIFINEEPLFFRKEIYAMACVIGGVVFGICMFFDLNIFITHILCGTSVFLTRILSVKYHICLPTLKDGE